MYTTSIQHHLHCIKVKIISWPAEIYSNPVKIICEEGKLDFHSCLSFSLPVFHFCKSLRKEMIQLYNLRSAVHWPLSAQLQEPRALARECFILCGGHLIRTILTHLCASNVIYVYYQSVFLIINHKCALLWDIEWKDYKLIEQGGQKRDMQGQRRVNKTDNFKIGKMQVNI